MKNKLTLLIGATMLFLGLNTLNAQDKDFVKVGGAVRFNYTLSEDKPDQLRRGGDINYDVFIINAAARYKKLSLVADYRCYRDALGGRFLKKGWVAYDFTPQDQMQFGLTQVPFGLDEVNSHGFYFSMPYYVGLEDDYDMGIKYSHKGQKLSFDLAYFKNSENTGNTADSRYGYDLTSMKCLDGLKEVDLLNIESHQLNARVIGHIKSGEVLHNMGCSALVGGIYDPSRETYGYRYAVAGHYEMKYKAWQFTTSVMHYNNLAPNKYDVIPMTAYGAPYLVASRGNIFSANLAYTHKIKNDYFDYVQVFNDFSMLDKPESDFENTYLNSLGMNISAGPIFVIVDLIFARNHPYMGGNFDKAMAWGDPDAKWQTRFNINMGYYF